MPLFRLVLLLSLSPGHSRVDQKDKGMNLPKILPFRIFATQTCIFYHICKVLMSEFTKPSSLNLPRRKGVGSCINLVDTGIMEMEQKRRNWAKTGHSMRLPGHYSKWEVYFFLIFLTKKIFFSFCNFYFFVFYDNSKVVYTCRIMVNLKM